MKRIENILLTVAVTIIGFATIACNVAAALSADSGAEEPYSSLEARYYTPLPQLDADSFLNGSFQDSLDGFLADHIPGRDDAVLFNAGLQRASIATAAASFGFDVYPTFFESDYYAIPRDGILSGRVEQAPTGEAREQLDAWVRTLNEAARNHPEKRFVYDCVIRHDQSSFNPTYRYYDNCLDAAWVQANFLDKLDPHIETMADAVTSYDEIKTEWFPNDGHWTLKRALDSYNAIAEKLALKKYPYENPITVTDSWYGDYARSGSDLDVSATLEDLPLDFSYLTFYYLDDVGGTPRDMGLRDSVLAGETELWSDGFSMYYEYFGGGSAEVVNSGEHNGKTLLLVGDSLTYCLTRYLASSYEHTVFLLPGNGRFDETMERYIERYNPDDVVFLMHASKYLSIAEYSPAFMGLDAVENE